MRLSYTCAVYMHVVHTECEYNVGGLCEIDSSECMHTRTITHSHIYIIKQYLDRQMDTAAIEMKISCQQKRIQTQNKAVFIIILYIVHIYEEYIIKRIVLHGLLNRKCILSLMYNMYIRVIHCYSYILCTCGYVCVCVAVRYMWGNNIMQLNVRALLEEFLFILKFRLLFMCYFILSSFLLHFFYYLYFCLYTYIV